MKKHQKKQLLDFLEVLGEAHEEIRRIMDSGNDPAMLDLLAQCQEGAAKIGDMIELSEGEDFKTIPLLESYCELVYQIYESVSNGSGDHGNRVYKKLRKALIQVENSVKYDIKTKLEIVFLPYKASMWDSLESIWQAADSDPQCNAYVVPIPYYDKNPDGSFGKYHYEGDDMPSYVPVTHYNSYNLEERKPDIVYIHNPYDHTNFVTSVDPKYYSYELKKHTDMLVYVPYYLTSGGMAEGQALCSAYLHVDYIVIQSEKLRKFFDPRLPDSKFLPLGSPKTDRVLRLCQNPPEPPAGWKERMAGKKVYFYNTSIGGMLDDTEKFLRKIEYVFQCFEGREDACLLWRPHPLLESTFTSMRKEYKPYYDRLKQHFLQNRLGIYDDTPDIEKTIALCDGYIGDSGSSVVPMFGVAGKPIFILNNDIHALPEEEDWRGEIIQPYSNQGDSDWMITQGNKLYHAPLHDYQYEFYCDLCEYAGGRYYLNNVVEIDGKIYVCPANAQEILILEDHKIQKKIALKRCVEKAGSFFYMWRIQNYLFLIPNKYPAIVRFDVRNNQVTYLEGQNNFFVKEVNGEQRIGGSCVWRNKLFIASPVEDKILEIDCETLKVKTISLGIETPCVWMGMVHCDDFVCMLPFTGTDIVCWNPDTGKTKIYNAMVDGLTCVNRINGVECMDKPFLAPMIIDNQMIFPPCWANFFVAIDLTNGKAKKWELPFAIDTSNNRGYFNYYDIGAFLKKVDTSGTSAYHFNSRPERKLYVVDEKTLEFQEIEISFDKGELLEHQSGFELESEWMQYCCKESALYSLADYLDYIVVGKPFQKEVQLQIYGKVMANCDGTCGERIHRFICSQVIL